MKTLKNNEILQTARMTVLQAFWLVLLVSVVFALFILIERPQDVVMGFK
jgi:hypothetical protein